MVMKTSIGQIINITCGRYDDYEIVATVKTLKEFDTVEVMEEFLVENPSYNKTGGFDTSSIEDSEGEYEFVNWLTEKGYVKELTTDEWHIADYHTPCRGEDEDTDWAGRGIAENEICDAEKFSTQDNSIIDTDC